MASPAAMLASVVLLIGLNYAASADAPKPCGLQMYLTPGCCDFPVAIPTESIKSCLNASGIELKGNFLDNLGENIKGLFGSKSSNSTSSNSTSSGSTSSKFNFTELLQSGKDILPKAVCVMECVLRKENLLTPSGDADKEKIKQKFLANVTDDRWKKIIGESVENCTEEIKKVNTTGLPVAKTKEGVECKIDPMFFAGCMRRKLMLNCPGVEKDATCSKNMQELKTCDPYSLDMGNNGIGGLIVKGVNKLKTLISKWVG